MEKLLEYGTSNPTNVREWWKDYSKFKFENLVIENTKPPKSSITLYLRVLDIIQKNVKIISGCSVDIILLNLKNPIKHFDMKYQTHIMSETRKDTLMMMLNDPRIPKDLIQSLLKYNMSISNLKQYVLKFKETLHTIKLQMFRKTLQTAETIDLTSPEISSDVDDLILNFNTSLMFQLEHPVLNSILLSEEMNYINLMLLYYKNYRDDLFDTTTYTTLQEISVMFGTNVRILTESTMFEFIEKNTDLLKLITNQHISSSTTTYNGPAGLLDSVEPLEDFVYNSGTWESKINK